jgi:hypothetical protein
VADEVSSHGPEPDKQRPPLWLARYPSQIQATFDGLAEYQFRGSEAEVSCNGGVSKYWKEGMFLAA